MDILEEEILPDNFRLYEHDQSIHERFLAFVRRRVRLLSPIPLIRRYLLHPKMIPIFFSLRSPRGEGLLPDRVENWQEMEYFELYKTK